METRQIVRNSTSRVTLGNLPKGHLNGILVSLKLKEVATIEDLGTALVEANIRSKFTHDRVEYLNTNTPLTAMIELSNLNFGSTGSLSRLVEMGEFSNGTDVLAVANSDENDDANVVSSKYDFMNSNIVFYVEYGSLYCDDGNEFETEIEFGSTFSDVFEGVNIYTVSREMMPFHFRKYDIDFDLNEDHKQVAQLFIFSETLEKDANVVVDSQSKQYDSDLEGFRASSQTFGMVENVSTGVLYQVFKSMYGVPEDVWVKITKNGTAPLQRDDSRFGILVVRLDFPLELTTQQNLRNLQNQLVMVQNYERSHGAQARAMIASNLMPSSSQLQEQIRQVQAINGYVLSSGSNGGIIPQNTMQAQNTMHTLR